MEGYLSKEEKMGERLQPELIFFFIVKQSRDYLLSSLSYKHCEYIKCEC